MKKDTLKLLGQLMRISQELWDEWVETGYSEESHHRYKLCKKIMEGLEEQQRKKLKSKVPYAKMAECLIQNYRHMNYKQLHGAVFDILYHSK